MAQLPDDAPDDDPDDHERACAVIALALGKSGTVRVANEAFEHLAALPHLDTAISVASRKAGTALRIALESDRAGVVGPALDSLCEFLRFQPGEARIRVDGWHRVFYGWAPEYEGWPHGR